MEKRATRINGVIRQLDLDRDSGTLGNHNHMLLYIVTPMFLFCSGTNWNNLKYAKSWNKARVPSELELLNMQ